MYDSANYPTSPEEAEAFVQSMRHGTLIAVAPGGHPQISILPFVKSAGVIDVHCVQADPVFAAVTQNPRVTFLVSDFLAFSPHDWVNAGDAARATLHFRAVQYECDAAVDTDPAAVAAALAALLRRQEPDATYRPLADDEIYGPRLRRLAALRLTIVRQQAKFKVGPAGPDELKLTIAARLRERDELGDTRAAAIIEARVDDRPRT